MAITVFYLATGGYFYFLFIKRAFLPGSKKKKSGFHSMKGPLLKKKAMRMNA